MRQDNRQIFLLFGHHAARIAVHNGNRRPPVTLAANPPIAQAIVDLPFSEAAFDQPIDGPPLRLGHREPIEKAGVDFDAVAGVRLAGPVQRPLDGLDDVESVRFREIPVSLVLTRHSHDSTGAVDHEHVVGDE